MSPAERLAVKVYAGIAAAYPVCAASDEFYFFPQVSSHDKNWQQWDDFSAAAVEDFADRLRNWEDSFSTLNAFSTSDITDIGIMRSTLRSLREQLIEIAAHTKQPTWHLTIVSAGLSEALESKSPEAWAGRIAGLPEFLQRAADCLYCVPQLFLAPGQAMVADLQRWLSQLQSAGQAVGKAPEALKAFAAVLNTIPTTEHFTLPEDHLEKLLRQHLCCRLGPDAILRELENEHAEMTALLQAEAARLAPGHPWQELEELIPFIQAPDGDLLELYRPELLRLESHVRTNNLIPEELHIDLAPDLAEVPENLAAIRASDAYTARPGHPARGGTFSVYSRGQSRHGIPGRTLEYRMTAAHETWPGHHLLDVCRWSLTRALRRPLERPLCYEGWACLAEELLAQTGYFDNPWDRFLLARRRIERAARGLADLGLQSGRLRIEEATRLLIEIGYQPARAAAVVPKYALRPGYQICYTIGLRKGLALLESYAPEDTGAFTRTFLRQGQIGFTALEKILSEQHQKMEDHQ